MTSIVIVELFILILDMIFTCFSETLIKGEIITNKLLILANYVNKGFLYDIVGIIAYIL